MDSENNLLKAKINNIASENKKNSYTFLVLLGFLGLFLVGFILGFLVNQNQNSGRQTIQYANDKSEYKYLDEIKSAIDNNYIQKNIDEQEMLYGSAKGMINALDDKFSTFLTPEEVKESDKGNAGVFEGIGTTLRFDGEYTVIETPIKDFPAWRAGLMPRDIILEVDGVDMSGQTAYLVADKILGKAGTTVKIKIFRESEGKTFDFEIVRERIDIDNIEVKEIEEGIYMITVRKFTENSVREFQQLWDKAIKEIGNNPKGIVLDLRNNPGGYVDGATYILEDFVQKGTKLLMEEDRNGKRKNTLSTREGRLVDVPLVVLVNNGSASASEIVAGAIKDYQLGMLVGESTLGKGVEQKVLTLSDGARIHLVFKKWLTPNGNQISFENPIQPDYEVEYTMDDFKEHRDPQLEKGLEIIKSGSGS